MHGTRRDTNGLAAPAKGRSGSSLINRWIIRGTREALLKFGGRATGVDGEQAKGDGRPASEAKAKSKSSLSMLQGAASKADGRIWCDDETIHWAH